MSEHVDVIIHFQGKKTSYRLRKGLSFQALCAHESTPIEFDCRKADCGICIYSVIKGMENLSEPTPAEADFLKAMRADDVERLACQSRIFGDVEIKVEDL